MKTLVKTKSGSLVSVAALAVAAAVGCGDGEERDGAGTGGGPCIADAGPDAPACDSTDADSEAPDASIENDAGQEGDVCVSECDSCPAGWASCTTSAACETEVSSNPKNCGACGHDCLGGDCMGGKCYPVTLTVQTGYDVGDLVLSSSFAYWEIGKNEATHEVALGRTSLSGNTTEINPVFIEWNWWQAFAAHGNRVYWRDQPKPFDSAVLYAFDFTDQSTFTVDALNTFAYPTSQFSVDDTELFWPTGYENGIRRINLATGAATDLVVQGPSQGKIAQLSSDSTFVYYVKDYDKGGSELFRISRAGGLSTSLFSSSGVLISPVTDGQFVYFKELPSGQPGWSLKRIAATGGAVQVLAPSETHSNNFDFCVDGDSLYYTAGFSTKRLRLSTGEVTEVFDTSGYGWVFEVASDAQRVYWWEGALPSLNVFTLRALVK